MSKSIINYYVNILSSLVLQIIPIILLQYQPNCETLSSDEEHVLRFGLKHGLAT